VEEVLRDGADLPGASYLMAILVAETDWLRTVCNPEKYSLAQSLDEVKLAKMLAGLKFSIEEEARFADRGFEMGSISHYCGDLVGPPILAASRPLCRRFRSSPEAA
jgi:hypothetical protein